MALPNGFFALGVRVGAVTSPAPGSGAWTATINGSMASIEAFGADLFGVFPPEELRFPRVDQLLAPGLNLSRPGLDARFGEVLAGGWIGTDFDDLVGGFATPVRLFLAHGNDSASGSLGADMLSGGAGEDVLDGRGGGDLLDGGAGDDRILAYAGDVIDGQDGRDTLVLNEPGTIGGGFSGGVAYRVRLAEAGLVGGIFADGFVEMPEFDLPPPPIALYSIENVEGSGSNDDIVGSVTGNSISGRAGDDTLDGAAGDDTLLGGGGFDILLGGDGWDVLDGGADDDQLWGGFGADALEGGAGIDTYLVEQPIFEGDPDALPVTFADIDLGLGFADYRHDAAIAATEAIGAIWSSGLQPSASLQSAGYHLLSGIENAVGGALSDRLRGSASDNLLDGGGSGDILEGRGGNDTIIGGAGNDVMRGGSGFDTADYATAIRPLLVQLWLNRAQSEATGVDDLQDFERVIAGSGDDTLVGSIGADEFKGERGADLLFGNAGDDTLWGGQGADTVRGEFGADRLYGDWENDLLLGDEGADTLFGFFGDDTLYGWLGRDRLLGEQGNDSLYGEQGDDFLGGLEDNDFLIGGDGNDVIFGDDGDDFLGGQSGMDVIVGGRGRDTLWGDEGADLFIFRRGDLQANVGDTIFSFAGAGPEADTIRLTDVAAADVSVSNAGNDAVIRIATAGGFAEILIAAARAADVEARIAYL